MPGTYSRIYIHIVFAVKKRDTLLHKSWRSELFRYISGIITGKGHKSIIVNGVEDHVHILAGLKPFAAISDIVRDVKNNSSGFIRDKGWVKGEFRWQEGYGAFSCGHLQLDSVYRYILNQEEHHRKETFRDEYMTFLREYGLEYQEQYLFPDWIG